jgi:hypothetical protein
MTAGTRWQRLRFALTMRLAASALFARDVLGLRFAPNHPEIRSRRAAAALSSPLCRKIFIPAGRRQIEAQLTLPEEPARALVLLCHGIGERLYFWTQVQLQLAESGIGSLVFHYSSYGQSRGPATTEAFEADARTAYAFLASLSPNSSTSTPPFLFGTSLGSAVAAHIAASVSPQPAGLILSEGFPSLREASAAVLAQVGIRHPVLSRLLPDVWHSAEAIKSVRCPILVVHSPAGQLFPSTMGEALYRAAEQRPSCRQTFLAPPGFAHNDVCLRPASGYWSPITDFILAEAAHFTKNAEPATNAPTAASTSATITYL